MQRHGSAPGRPWRDAAAEWGIAQPTHPNAEHAARIVMQPSLITASEQPILVMSGMAINGGRRDDGTTLRPEYIEERRVRDSNPCASYPT